MKWFAPVVLVLAPAFVLPGSAASGQAVSSDSSDPAKEYEPQALQSFQLSLSPSVAAEDEAQEAPALLLSLLPSEAAKGDEPPAAQPSRLSLLPSEDGGHFGLPLLGEEARKAGYEIPKPFGLGAIYTDIVRDVQVTDVRVGINGGKVSSLSDFVSLRARTHVNVALGKFDIFVFPFLNVYGLVGYVNNETRIQGTAILPTLGPGRRTRSVPIDVTTRIEGPVGGLGLTLAGGYKELFAALDVNWSETNLGFDDNFRAAVASLRTGWNGKVHAVPVRLWTGVIYWNTFATASGSSNSSGVGSIQFEADQGPANPWNVVFGGHVTLPKNFDLLFEVGTNFNDVRTLTAGLTYRF